MSYKVNELQYDEFGRVSGIMAINKPVGITSHDVVAKLRRILNTRKVGHAGALDPFASGVLITLVGKATKLANKFIDSDKEYLSTVLFGVQTDSGDIEGKIINTDFVNSAKLGEESLRAALPKFTPGYEQYVPVFSSVKVNGDKLRVLARQAESHEVTIQDGKRVAIFHMLASDGSKNTKQVEIPSHYRKISLVEMEKFGKINLSETIFHENLQFDKDLPQANIRIACSKGTYIRVLAEDIGKALNPELPAVLTALQRTRVDRIPLKQALTLAEVEERYSTNSKG